MEANGQPMPPMGANGQPLPPTGPENQQPVGLNEKEQGLEEETGDGLKESENLARDNNELSDERNDSKIVKEESLLDNESAPVEEESKVDSEHELIEEDKMEAEAASTADNGADSEEPSAADTLPELGDEPAMDGGFLNGNGYNQSFTSQFEEKSVASRIPTLGGMPMPGGIPTPGNIPTPGGIPTPGNVPTPRQFFVRVKTGEQINIDKAEFKIGHKASEVDYAVSDNSAISRVHCIITKRNGVCFVRDNRSTNGTFVNGSELPLGKEQFLTNGASMILGDEEFIFHVE
jgi:hypothetical protein